MHDDDSAENQQSTMTAPQNCKLQVIVVDSLIEAQAEYRIAFKHSVYKEVKETITIFEISRYLVQLKLPNSNTQKISECQQSYKTQR